MNQQQQPGPTPQPGQPGMPGQKKGMSTGCIVALVIVGVLLALIIIGGIFAYVKCGDFVKYGGVTVAEEIKKSMAENPQPGVDTTAVNGALDTFIAKTQEQEEPNMEAIGQFIQSVQHVLGDEQVDSLEAIQVINAAHMAYPEAIEEPEEEVPVDTAMIDTAAGETM